MNMTVLHTATSHADTKTFFISTTLAVGASSDGHVTTANVFAFELVTVTGVAQEERLDARQSDAVTTEL